MSGRRLLGSLMLWSLMLGARDARAADPPGPSRDVIAARKSAAELFEKGSAALDAGRPAEAAEKYLAADALAPNDDALEAAIDAAVKADAAALVLEGAERALSRRGVRESLKALATRARTAHAATVTLRCDAPCSATLDGAPRATDLPHYVLPGRHEIRWKLRDGSTATSELALAKGTASTVEPPVRVATTVTNVGAPRPVSAAPTPPPTVLEPLGGASHRPLSPWVFWAGVGLTTVTSGFAIGSGIDTAVRHASFVDDGCRVHVTTPDCASAAESGRSAETRTNVAVGVAIGAAVVTTVLAVVFVDFGHAADPRTSARPRPTPDGAMVRF